MKKPDFNKQFRVLLIIFGGQFLLGMAITLFYQQFPKDQASQQVWEFAWHELSFPFYLISIILVIGFLGLLIRFWKSNQLKERQRAILGLVGFLIVGFGGASFIPNQTIAYFLITVIGFLLAANAYRQD